MIGIGGLNYSSAAFIGDSITLGIRSGVTAAQCVPTLVSAAKRFSPFVNAGKSGDTSTGGLARFESDVLAFGPSMIGIGFGHNDPGASISTATYSANITEMVRKAKITGARVTLWVPIYAQDGTLNSAIAPYRTVMRGLASSLSCDLFDLYDDIVAAAGATQNSYYIESAGSGQHFSVAGNAWAAGKPGSGAYANSFVGAVKA